MSVDIKAQLALLRELQEIDIHLRDVEEELVEIPHLIEEAKSEWNQANTELTKKEEEKAVAEKERRSLEQELEGSVARLQERENKLYAIKTNKEYQAALKEIADGKRANKEREDAILKRMEKIERLSQEITQLSQRVADTQKEFEKDVAELEAKKKELEKEQGVRVEEFGKIEKKVDKSLIEKYNFIRSKLPDPLAAVARGICQGCNMNVPAQMYIELLKSLTVHFCPSCHRFIYADEGGTAEEKEGLVQEGPNPGGNHET